MDARAFASPKRLRPRRRAFASPKRLRPRRRAFASPKRLRLRRRAFASPKRLRPRRRVKPAHDGVTGMSAPFHLRPYTATDEDAAITLWRDTWQQAYPSIDFAARETWW